MASEETQEFLEYVQECSDKFDKLCQERHESGQKEYGQFTFLSNDVVRMMLEELADTVNYCRYQSIKLMILQEHIENDLGFLGDESSEEITIGVKAFKGTSDVGWSK